MPSEQPQAGRAAPASAEPTVVVIAALARGGASTLASALAKSAAGLGGSVLVDAATVRRSATRALCAHEGPGLPVAGVSLTRSRDRELQVIHVTATGALDERFDRRDDLDLDGDGLVVVDVGTSLEEALAGGDRQAIAWLTGPVWPVLVLPTDAGGLTRSELLLQQWRHEGLAPIGTVATLGPTQAQPDPGSLVEAVLARAVQVPWHPQDAPLLVGQGPVPPAFATTALQILSGVDHPIQTAATAALSAAGEPRRGFLRRRAT